MGDRSKQARGRWGEELACRHLRGLDYEILDRNWRSSEPHVRGELDIVARLGDTIVFCEVKARRRSGYGSPAAAVDDRKQSQIRVLAESWLRAAGADRATRPGAEGRRSNERAFDGVRFDVIAIEGVRLDHLTAAF